MKHPYKLYIFLLFITLQLSAAEISDTLRIDAYANVDALSDTQEQADNGLNISGGIQARYQVSDNISATAQVYIYDEQTNSSNTTFDIDTKWLYVDYYAGYDITLRAGKFQFPIFKSAETGTIGYSYTWSETPLNNYGANGYEDFTGAEVLQKYFYEDFDFLLQLSYGKSKNELPTNKDNATITGETDSLVGITFKTNHDLFNFNIGYLQATSKLDDANYKEADFQMYAFEGEIYIADATLKAGYIDVKLSELFPDELKYYLSLEYNYKNFTPYIYYASENLYFKEESSIALDRPTLSQASGEKYSTGLRYDFYENMALKLSYTKSKNSSEFSNNTDEVEDSNRYKAVFNVIF